MNWPIPMGTSPSGQWTREPVPSFAAASERVYRIVNGLASSPSRCPPQVDRDQMGVLKNRPDRSVCPTLGYGSSCLSVARTPLSARPEGETGVFQQAPEIAVTQSHRCYYSIYPHTSDRSAGAACRHGHPPGSRVTSDCCFGGDGFVSELVSVGVGSKSGGFTSQPWPLWSESDLSPARTGRNSPGGGPGWDSIPRRGGVRKVWASAAGGLDEGTYLCSVRTMHRILAENRAVRERRDQLRHPEYHRPELLATGPNQPWSWDITKLKGPHAWNCFHLYVVLDVYTRKVVGWLLADRESATLALELIRQSCQREGIGRDALTVHADRGSSMRSKPVAFLLANLGVTKTHSRPYTSTDNPYSEAQFKTLKYQPDFPERFGSREHARAFLVGFFDWYNNEHRHSGIGLVTPSQRHSGADRIVYAQRQTILAAFYEQHPERFVRGIPSPPELPGEVWINKPDQARKAA